MEKLKVFLASSISEFKDLRNEIGDLVRVLQNKLIDENVIVDLFECEFADNTMVMERMQETYNNEIRKSDIFILLAGNELGKFTAEEYDVSKEKNDLKRYIFFRGNSHDISIEGFKKQLKDDKKKFKSSVYYDCDDKKILDEIEKVILENKRVTDVQLDKKIYLFLAAREEDIKCDKYEIGNFVRSLNDIYLDKNVYFYLVTNDTIEQFDDNNIENSEMFFIVFGNNLSEESLREFNLAYDKFKNTHNPKIATFVKNEDNYDDSVMDFLKKLDNDLGHYYSIYSHADTIKLNISMQLNQLGFQKVNLVANDGKIYLNDTEILSSENIPMFANNEQLSKYRKEAVALEKKYWDLKDKVKLEKNQGLEKELEDVTKRYNKIKEDISYMENMMLTLKSSLIKEASNGTLSPKQVYAIKCLEKGLLDEAKEVLNLDGIHHDIKEIEKKSGKNEIKSLIQDLILRAETYKLDLENKDRIKEIEASYEMAIEAEKNNGIPRDTLKVYATFCSENKMYDKAVSLLESYYNWAKADAIDLDISFYLDLANSCYLANLFDKAYSYYDIVFSLLNDNQDDLLYVKANSQYLDLLVSEYSTKSIKKAVKLCNTISTFIVDHNLLDKEIYMYYYGRCSVTVACIISDIKMFQKLKLKLLTVGISWLDAIKDDSIDGLVDFKLKAYDAMIHYYIFHNDSISAIYYFEQEFELLHELIYRNPAIYEQKFMDVFGKLKDIYLKYYLYDKLGKIYDKYIEVLDSKIVLSNVNDNMKESMHEFMVNTLVDKYLALATVAKRNFTLDGFMKASYYMEKLIDELKEINSDYSNSFIEEIEDKVEKFKHNYEVKESFDMQFKETKDKMNQYLIEGDALKDNDKKLDLYHKALQLLIHQDMDLLLIMDDIFKVYSKIINVVKDISYDRVIDYLEEYLNYALKLKEAHVNSSLKYDYDNIIAHAYDFMGVAYFKLGNYKRALKYFEMASELDLFLKRIDYEKYGTCDYEYVSYHLIAALLKLKKNKRALELKNTTLNELDRIIEKHPKFSTPKSIKESILNFEKGVDIYFDTFEERGEVEVLAVDQFNKPIKWVNITMIDTSDSTEIGTLSTRSDGKIDYYNVPANKYSYKINYAPKGCKFVVNDQVVEVFGGKKSYVIFTCEKIIGKLNFRLVDEKDNGLAGAKFKLYGEDYHYYDAVITDEDGYVHYTLDCGKYYIKQFDTPEGYCLDERVFDFEISENKWECNSTVVNRKIHGNIGFNVKDKKGNAVSGYKIAFFDTDYKEITSGVTKENGKLGVKNIPFGNYFYRCEGCSEYVPFKIIEDGKKITKEIVVE